mgnify:CR=1|jgi:ammonia channel protein AmtB|tara:strand:+ start:1497 stop:1715 length:219 start_codon:yes stop_codon:yes gene_type:complete
MSWLIPTIYVLIALILVSLATSLFFLFKDGGVGKRTVYSLGYRVTLAVILLALIAYGLHTGELGRNPPPWSS